MNEKINKEKFNSYEIGKMITEKINARGKEYLVRIHIESRKNCSASIGRREINIRIPRFLEREQRRENIKELKNRIAKKLEEEPERFSSKEESQKEKQKEYKNNDKITIGNKEYTLKIDSKNKKNSSACLKGSIIYISLSDNLSDEKRNKHISTLISRCLAKERLPELEKRIHGLNKKYFNQSINKIFFKNLKSKWGSCSEAGNINLSTRLLFAPDDVLEYVCAHELAHLIEPNHSKNFWKLIENAIPNYKDKIKWLKENGHKCVF